eukprot:gene11259-biopygen19868
MRGIRHRREKTRYGRRWSVAVGGRLACASRSLQHLTAALQHLTASLQHLTVSLQHLTASLQHLTASLQHLAASLQHLVASFLLGGLRRRRPDPKVPGWSWRGTKRQRGAWRRSRGSHQACEGVGGGGGEHSPVSPNAPPPPSGRVPVPRVWFGTQQMFDRLRPLVFGAHTLCMNPIHDKKLPAGIDGGHWRYCTFLSPD